MVVSHSCSGFISPEALVSLDGGVPLAGVLRQHIVLLLLGIGVLNAPPVLDPVERRLGDVEIAVVDQIHASCRYMKVRMRVRMCEPSTSASVIMMTLW